MGVQPFTVAVADAFAIAVASRAKPRFDRFLVNTQGVAQYSGLL